MQTEFKPGGQLPDALPDDPMPLVEAWYDYAQQHAGQRNPNAMTLATVDAEGQPSARVVLCKALVTDPGYLVFYTNYESNKARAMRDNAAVAIVMHWDALGLQIRFEGTAARSPASESDAYFASRGWGSQLGAWGSDQSRPIANRAALVQQVRERAARLGVELGDDTATLTSATPPSIKRPDRWGGYRVWLNAIELWVEGADRIHDRARWERGLKLGDDDQFAAGRWSVMRLQP